MVIMKRHGKRWRSAELASLREERIDILKPWKVGIRARHFAFGIAALVSLFIALWVTIGDGVHKKFETPTPYWTGPEKWERLAGEYVWLWMGFFTSVIMYAPLYFCTKGRFKSSIDS